MRHYSLDATAFFHEKAVGAHSAMSGLAALLAAASTINAVFNSLAGADGEGGSPFDVPVVFAALAAEDWSYAGSRWGRCKLRPWLESTTRFSKL